MKRGDWEVFQESGSHKNRTKKKSVVEYWCVTLRKGVCGQRCSQALLSQYPLSWLKFSGHLLYICGLFIDVWMLPMTSALSESIAYFIPGVFGYHLLLALQLCV